MFWNKVGLIKEFIMRYVTNTFVALLIVVSGVAGRESWQGWEELWQVRGEISISHGKELRLIISDNNYESFAHLASLGENYIQNVYIRCRYLQDSDLVHLKGLTHLKNRKEFT